MVQQPFQPRCGLWQGQDCCVPSALASTPVNRRVLRQCVALLCVRAKFPRMRDPFDVFRRCARFRAGSRRQMCFLSCAPGRLDPQLRVPGDRGDSSGREVPKNARRAVRGVLSLVACCKCSTSMVMSLRTRAHVARDLASLVVRLAGVRGRQCDHLRRKRGRRLASPAAAFQAKRTVRHCRLACREPSRRSRARVRCLCCRGWWSTGHLGVCVSLNVRDTEHANGDEGEGNQGHGAVAETGAQGAWLRVCHTTERASRQKQSFCYP